MAFINSDCCANCQFWDGSRKVSSFKKFAEVKSASDQGICLNKKSANSKGRPQRADHPKTCGGFQKWDQLK